MSILETGKNLLSFFPDVGNHFVDSKVFKKIKYNSNNSYYENAISLAKLIIQDTGLDLNSGSENVVSFLFDMNQLFEEFIYKICKKEFKEDEYNVHRRGMRFWEKKLIKPDIVIENSKCGNVVIFDTKWKVPNDLRPNDLDLKQIFVYNHYYGSPISYLLYPSNHDGKNLMNLISPGEFQDYFKNGEYIKNSCYLGFMPIGDEGKLDLKGTQKWIREMYLVATLGTKNEESRFEQE
jgi:5-methylcytosine-specific restriction enzyme subunit McrC